MIHGKLLTFAPQSPLQAPEAVPSETGPTPRVTRRQASKQASSATPQGKENPAPAPASAEEKETEGSAEEQEGQEDEALAEEKLPKGKATAQPLKSALKVTPQATPKATPASSPKAGVAYKKKDVKASFGPEQVPYKNKKGKMCLKGEYGVEWVKREAEYDSVSNPWSLLMPYQQWSLEYLQPPLSGEELDLAVEAKQAGQWPMIESSMDRIRLYADAVDLRWMVVLTSELGWS